MATTAAAEEKPIGARYVKKLVMDYIQDQLIPAMRLGELTITDVSRPSGTMIFVNIETAAGMNRQLELSIKAPWLGDNDNEA